MNRSDGMSSHTSLTGANSSISNFVIGNSAQKSNSNSRQNIDDVASLDEAEESLKYKQNEDLKRYFYTIAIHNSKKILKNIPQGSTLKTLYSKCIVRSCLSNANRKQT